MTSVTVNVSAQAADGESSGGGGALSTWFVVFLSMLAGLSRGLVLRRKLPA